MPIRIEKYGVQDYRILNRETTEEIDLYVRATAGDDTNNGRSVLAPLRTLQAAYDKVPFIVNHTVRIHLGAHAGDGYVAPLFENRILNQHVIVIGDGAGEAGDGVTNLLSDTAIAGSDNLQVTITGPIVADDYIGKTIRITSGNSIGDRRTIKSNTTTSIVAATHFSDTIDPGDTFVIEEPSIAIDISAEQPVCSLAQKGINEIDFELSQNAWGLVWANLQLYPLLTGASLIVSGTMYLYGIESDALNVYVRGLLCAGIDDSTDAFPTAEIGLLFGAPSDVSWKGWGLVGAYYANAKGPGFVGYWISDASSGLQIQQGSALRIFGGRTRFITMYNSDESPPDARRTSLSIFGEDDGVYSRFLINQPESLATYPAVFLHHISARLINCEIQDAADNEGIRVEGDSWVELENIIGTTQGIGVLTYRGGIVRWNGPQDLTGTLGDFSEDDGTTTRAAATLVDDSYFIDATRRSRIFRSDD